jgi:hypothetical protein
VLIAKERMLRAVADVVEEVHNISVNGVCKTTVALRRPHAERLVHRAWVPAIRQMQQPSGEEGQSALGLAEIRAGRLALLMGRSPDENNSRTHVEAWASHTEPICCGCWRYT